MSDMLADAFDQLLRNRCDPSVVRAIETGASWRSLWQDVEDGGFADALVAERHGGAGLTLIEVFPMIEVAGRHALPVPLADTVFARAWLADVGVARPAGSIALARGSRQRDGGIDGGCVRGGACADAVLVSLDGGSVLLSALDAERQPTPFVLDAHLSWSNSAVAAAPRIAATYDVTTVQGCTHAALLAGAMAAVFAQTLRYANEREQFGRPIGKFQAIQHQLAVIAEHVFAAGMAARIAWLSPSTVPDALQVAIGKGRASEAAVEVAALAHSIHGAIGFTQAFDLQLWTRRLHQWRQAGGSESWWHDVAGAALVDGHAGKTLDLMRQATVS